MISPFVTLLKLNYKLMKTINLFLVVCVLALCSSASYAEKVSVNKKVSNFHSIDVSTGLKVTLVESKTEGLKLLGEKKDIDDVVVEVENACLHLYFKKSGIQSGNNFHKSVEVEVSFKTLQSIKLSSGSSCKSPSKLSFAELAIDQNSGSVSDIEFSATNVKLGLSSGAIATLKGEAKSVNINQSSGSELNAIDFNVKTASVDLSTGSICKMAVSDKLKAGITTGASLKYKGSPIVDSDKSTGGSIHKID
jgi:hypothetical protein